jgi:hypothetical protein
MEELKRIIKQRLTVYKKVAPFYPFGYDESKGYFMKVTVQLTGQIV